MQFKQQSINFTRFVIQILQFRWISWHGKYHSQARCEYLQTIFLCAIITRASTRRLVDNFQLICYLQRANARWQYVNSGRSSSFSEWLNDGMVAVVKHCRPLVQGLGRRGCRERWLKTTTKQVFKKFLVCSVSRRVIVITLFRPRLHGIGYVQIRLGSDPLWYGSTLFTRDRFETRTLQFHIRSPS